MTLYEWVVSLIGMPLSVESDFVVYSICAAITIISFVLSISLFIGIAFAIFRR